MTMLFGSFSERSMPVDDRMTFSSISKPGMERGRDPVATIMTLPRSVSVPAPVSTLTLRESTRVPLPFTYSTLFFLRRYWMPLDSLSAARREAFQIGA
jgi:hypothetical protein